MVRPSRAAATVALLSALELAAVVGPGLRGGSEVRPRPPAAKAIGAAQGAPERREGPALDEDEAHLAPGLLAVYRSLAQGPHAVPVVRLDPKPAFTWGRSSPHPR